MSENKPLHALAWIAASVWFGACSVVLVITIFSYEPGPKADAGQFFILAMLALTFPAGLIPISILAAVFAAGNATGTELLELLPAWAGFSVLWLSLLAAGYLQWFKGVPWLWRKLSKAQRSI
jgi:hypothetical protein